MAPVPPLPALELPALLVAPAPPPLPALSSPSLLHAAIAVAETSVAPKARVAARDKRIRGSTGEEFVQREMLPVDILVHGPLPRPLPQERGKRGSAYTDACTRRAAREGDGPTHRQQAAEPAENDGKQAGCDRDGRTNGRGGSARLGRRQSAGLQSGREARETGE